MNIFINTFNLYDGFINGSTQRRFPFLYFWLKDHYYQRSEENFTKTHWDWYDGSIDFAVNKDVQEKFAKNPPDIYCVSLYLWSDKQLLENTRWVKKHYPECTILAGGASIDLSPEWFESNPQIDIVVNGPGAEILRLIIDAKFNDNMFSVDGITYYQDGKVKTNKPINRKDDPLVINYVNNFPDEVYNAMNVMHSRRGNNVAQNGIIWQTVYMLGCPYMCSFCAQGDALWTKISKRTNIQHLYDEINFIRKFPNISIEFIDSNFGIVPEYDEILNYIIESNKTAGLTHNKLMIKKPDMAKNNIDTVWNQLERIYDNKLTGGNTKGYIAIQDTNTDVLKLNKRPPSKEFEKIKLFGELTEDMQYRSSYVDIMLGLPGQTFDSLSSTLLDLYNNKLLVDTTGTLYLMFPIIRDNLRKDGIWFKTNTVKVRNPEGHGRRILENAIYENELEFDHIIELENLTTKELMSAYYAYTFFGHVVGFLNWFQTPINYLKNYHNIDGEQLIKNIMLKFNPENHKQLPDKVVEDIDSITDWMVGKTELLMRMDNYNKKFLSLKKASVYRFHADTHAWGEVIKQSMKEVIGKDDTNIDKLIDWQVKKVLKFDGVPESDYEIESINYDDYAQKNADMYYTSKFKFVFPIIDRDELYELAIDQWEIQFIPEIQVTAIPEDLEC